MHFENTLHGLSKQPKSAHTFTVTEAAAEIGRIQAVLGIKKIIVQASDGSDLVFPIEDRSHAGGQRK